MSAECVFPDLALPAHKKIAAVMAAIPFSEDGLAGGGPSQQGEAAAGRVAKGRNTSRSGELRTLLSGPPALELGILLGLSLAKTRLRFWRSRVRLLLFRKHAVL